MKAIIVSNGSFLVSNFYQEIFNKKNFDLIICADGGAKILKKIGVIPDIILGDLDSIKEDDKDYFINRTKFIKYNSEKDETDTELAVDYCIQNGVKEVLLIGVLGTRLDHSLANIYLLKKLLKNNVSASIINENNEIYLMDKSFEIINRKGCTVSLLPFSDEVFGIYTKGLYYSLNNGKMVKEKPYGVSNIIVNNYAKIEIQKGLLLIIISFD